jgi:hypothetical protein
MRPLDGFLGWWARLKEAFARAAESAARVRRRIERSKAWRWLRRELELIAKVAGVVTLSLWLKRLIEQFLDLKVVNQSILTGEMNDIVRGIEVDIDARRSRHGRRRR